MARDSSTGQPTRPGGPTTIPRHQDGALAAAATAALLPAAAPIAAVVADAALWVAAAWASVAVLALGAVVLWRRYHVRPLADLAREARDSAAHERFARLSDRYAGPVGDLADGIAQMVRDQARMTAAVRHRERALADLYHEAPAAMLSVDGSGRISAANQRAARLLGCTRAKDLRGGLFIKYVDPADRPVFHRTVRRLGLERGATCDLRMQAGERSFEARVECARMREDDGSSRAARLSLIDVSGVTQLRQNLAEKGRLLDLLINHMSDAILLVDEEGRIVAHNQKLAALLNCRPEALTGARYEPWALWDGIGAYDHEQLVKGLHEIEADRHRPAHYRCEARLGTFLFQGVAVEDERGRPAGRLWVVQECSSQDETRRLLEQQARQLRAVQTLGQSLAGVRGNENLLTRAGTVLYELFEVDAVGLTLRDGSRTARGVQVLHRGPGAYLLDVHRPLVDAIQRRLLPRVLNGDEVAHWAELPASLPWSAAFAAAGLTSLAAAPLLSGADVHGMIWIAQRGGQPLQRQHMNLLECLAPMIASRVEYAALRQFVHGLDQLDPVTDLPSQHRLITEARGLDLQPGRVWGAVVLDLDDANGAPRHTADHDACAVLKVVASALRRRCRRSNLIVRLEGPRFGVLCFDVDRDEAAHLAERLRSAIGTIPAHLLPPSTLPLSVSVGVATCPADGTSAARVLAEASWRAGIAKCTGGDRVVASSHQPALSAG